jgi:hypothetical protein
MNFLAGLFLLACMIAGGAFALTLLVFFWPFALFVLLLAPTFVLAKKAIASGKDAVAFGDIKAFFQMLGWAVLSLIVMSAAGGAWSFGGAVFGWINDVQVPTAMTSANLSATLSLLLLLGQWTLKALAGAAVMALLLLFVRCLLKGTRLLNWLSMRRSVKYRYDRGRRQGNDIGLLTKVGLAFVPAVLAFMVATYAHKQPSPFTDPNVVELTDGNVDNLLSTTHGVIVLERTSRSCIDSKMNYWKWERTVNELASNYKGTSVHFFRIDEDRVSLYSTKVSLYDRFGAEAVVIDNRQDSPSLVDTADLEFGGASELRKTIEVTVNSSNNQP